MSRVITFAVRVVLTVIIGLACLISLPLGIIPVILIRRIVSLAARVLRPDLGSAIEGYDSHYVPSVLPTFTMNFLLILENGSGNMLLGNIREQFDRTIMRERDEKGGLLFKRFCEYPTTFLGYSFWKVDKEFRVGNHIRKYGGKTEGDDPVNLVYQEDLPELVKKLQGLAFKEKQSPWEFLVVEDVKSREEPSQARTVLVLRVHHVLADVLSMAGVSRCFFGTKCSHASPVRNSGWITGFKERSVAPFICFYVISGWILDTIRLLPLKTIKRARDVGDDFSYGMSKSIPLEQIKSIAKGFDVSVASVLHSVTAGAMVKALGKQKPDLVKFFTVLPLPDHPPGLVNHNVGVTKSYPGMCDSPPETRLQRFHTLMEVSRTKHEILIMHLGAKFASFFPENLKRFITKRTHGVPDITLTNIPVFELPPSVAGLKVLDSLLFAPASQGITTTVAGGNGQLRFHYVMKGVDFGDSQFLSNLCRFVSEEVGLLAEL